MPQGLPRLGACDAIYGKAVVVLKSFHRAPGAIAEVPIGAHWAIQIPVAQLAQLMLQLPHGIAL